MLNRRRLSPYELDKRLQLDYRVCQYMFGSIFSGEAYQTTEDMERGTNPITSYDMAHLAKKYRIDFHVKTLIGPGPLTESTTFGFDVDVDNYPYAEPANWIISSQVPYSPHFRQVAPSVCTGEIWKRAKGYMLLGQLLVHVAKLLNWEEIARGGGYIGWNPDAIDYHNRVYGGKPISELRYPVLPPDVYGFEEDAQPLFVSLQPSASSEVPTSLFKGKGRG